MPTLEDVQGALQRCLAAEPPVDFALSQDAAQLATVFAEMRFRQDLHVDEGALKPKQVAALERWHR